MNQQLWTDAVYVRDFRDFARLDSTELLKIALIADELYGSFDLAALALRHVDEKLGTRHEKSFLDAVLAGLAA